MTSTQAPATGTCELCSRPTTNLQQFVLVFVDTFEQSTVSRDVKTTNYTLFRTASACVCDQCGERRRLERRRGALVLSRWVLPPAVVAGVIGGCLLWFDAPADYAWIAFIGAGILGAIAAIGFEDWNKSAASFADDLARARVTERVKDQAKAMEHSAQSMLPVFTRSTQTLQVMTPDEWEAVRHAAEMQRLGR
jgi:hypothetical protein